MPVLYQFPPSVWAKAANLAVEELEYPGIKEVEINLLEGKNFEPSFLLKNPNATLPTLETEDGQIFGSADEVVSYLNKSSKGKKLERSKTDFIEIIHKDEVDPNYPLLSSTNEDEFKSNGKGFASLWLNGRQKALEKYSKDKEAEPFKDFYKEKLEFNSTLLDFYNGKKDDSFKKDFFAKSQKNKDARAEFITQVLPRYLPENGGFITGSVPGEDDLHAAAVLARYALIGGTEQYKDGLKGLEKTANGPVPDIVKEYWNAWTKRPSFQKVYGEKLA